MRTNFDRAFDLLMEMEGYESNDKRDPGGRTKWGIAHEYHPEVNLDTLTAAHAAGSGSTSTGICQQWRTAC